MAEVKRPGWRGLRVELRYSSMVPVYCAAAIAYARASGICGDLMVKVWLKGLEEFHRKDFYSESYT